MSDDWREWALVIAFMCALYVVVRVAQVAMVRLAALAIGFTWMVVMA